MFPIPVQWLLEVLGEFDEFGGASLGLVAWELSVEEHRVRAAWAQAQQHDLIKPAGHDPLHDEQMWRLTASGCTALRDSQRDSA